MAICGMERLGEMSCAVLYLALTWGPKLTSVLASVNIRGLSTCVVQYLPPHDVASEQVDNISPSPTTPSHRCRPPHRHRTAPRESVAESVPAIAFWRELPGLMRDGWAFTVEKVRAYRSGSQYETL